MLRAIRQGFTQIIVLSSDVETIYKIPLHGAKGMVKEITLVVPGKTLSAASNGAAEVSHIVIRDFNYEVEPLASLCPRSSHAEELK